MIVPADDHLVAWINARIGKPWAIGAGGPDAYDCLGLVRAAYRDLCAVEIPPVDVDAALGVLGRRTIRRLWRPSPSPVHLSIVVMGRSRDPHHVGVWFALDRGLCVHALEGAGVVASTPLQLVAMGFQRLRWLTYAGPDADGAAQEAEAA
jgi:hypothetical protein